MCRIKTYTCQACGYPRLYTPPFTHGVGSLEMCPCCFYQPGYDDVVLASGRDLSPPEWRERWVAQGVPWESKMVAPPDGWDPPLQLQNVERS
jgi:hypothetical protein